MPKIDLLSHPEFARFEALRRAISEALAANPKKRFSDMESFRTVNLATFLQGEEIAGVRALQAYEPITLKRLIPLGSTGLH